MSKMKPGRKLDAFRERVRLETLQEVLRIISIRERHQRKWGIGQNTVLKWVRDQVRALTKDDK